MPPFPPLVSSGGIDQSRSRPEGSGRQAGGTTGGIKSKCRAGKKGIDDREVKEREKKEEKAGWGL